MSPVYQAGTSSSMGLNEAIVAASCITAGNASLETLCFEPLNDVYQSYQQNIDKKLRASPHSKLYLSPALLFSHNPQLESAQDVAENKLQLKTI